MINDHLGTPQMLINENKHVVWKANYDEFGKVHIQVEEVEFNLRFPGQYYDKETGLNYNYYRDYDSSLGRYVQSDHIGLAGGINTYAYVLNNPLRYTDRFGLELDGTWGEALPWFPNRSEHANRNKNNICPAQEPSSDECSVNDFEKDKEGGMASMLNDGHVKYRSPTGYECQYDENGKLLPDENGNYSYNYSHYGSDSTFWDGVSHGWQDVAPHAVYGGNGSYTKDLTAPY